MPGKFYQLMRVKAEKKLPKDQLLERILNFLKTQTMCTLCTCRNNVPRATPLEYYNDGTSLYMIPHKGVKMANLRANPKVSIGVYNHVHPRWADGQNWLGVIGAQITGTARLIPDSDPEYFEARDKYRSPTITPDRDRTPKGRMMLRIDCDRIEYLDIALKLEGYASKQVWTSPRRNLR
ncbi:MAG: pyridoxamine 5'-phosphate oxidase family protein [Chloroflexota bacterium]